MAKTIVFCADGTWNNPGQDDDQDGTPDPTNVWKLFRLLEGDDDDSTTLLGQEQEIVHKDSAGNLVQVAKYLHGVGDSKNPLVRALGGGLGAGIIARILRGYTFISRHYQKGDKVVLIGFSRGAYTVRSLADFILNHGLLKPKAASSKEEAYRKAGAAWTEYRRQKFARQQKPSLRERLDNIIEMLPGYLSKPVNSADFAAIETITAIGVWDTVGALGVPSYRQDAQDNVFQFADNVLSPRVEHGFHAVAMDEQRKAFEPTLWQPNKGQVVQVLFPGAHGDVGGGYTSKGKQSDLSDIALDWMITQLSGLNCIAFKQRAQIVPNPKGVAHQPWNEGAWKILPPTPRAFRHGLAHGIPLHGAVLGRLGQMTLADPHAAPATYRPAPCVNCPQAAMGTVSGCCSFA